MLSSICVLWLLYVGVLYLFTTYLCRSSRTLHSVPGVHTVNFVRHPVCLTSTLPYARAGKTRYVLQRGKTLVKLPCTRLENSF